MQAVCEEAEKLLSKGGVGGGEGGKGEQNSGGCCCERFLPKGRRVGFEGVQIDVFEQDRKRVLLSLVVVTVVTLDQ